MAAGIPIGPVPKEVTGAEAEAKDPAPAQAVQRVLERADAPLHPGGEGETKVSPPLRAVDSVKGHLLRARRGLVTKIKVKAVKMDPEVPMGPENLARRGNGAQVRRDNVNHVYAFVCGMATYR